MSERSLGMIEVPSLSSGDAAGLVDALLPRGTLPDELRTTIVARAEGNPYFLEETVRHLAEAGAPRSGLDPGVIVARIEALTLADVASEGCRGRGRYFLGGSRSLALGAMTRRSLRSPRTGPHLHPPDPSLPAKSS